MDAAKQAVNKIIGRSGQHTTEVHEEVNPAVTSETIKPHRHEETTQAVDREVHQDHYHTTVQPLQDKQVLPEQHTHQMMPVQERSFTHGDTEKIRSGVETEAAQFMDTSKTEHTTHSASTAPAAAGEHVHHHVHERVQPVVNRETVQPEVVHTTVPIHETHQAEAQHHGMSTLPTKTLAEFENMGGKIAGGATRHEEYEGHPRPYNPEMQTSRDVGSMSSGITGTTGTTGTHHGQHGTTGTTGTTSGVSGTTGTNVSGVGHSSTGAGYTDYSQGGTTGSTGTSLGGRAEGNTTSRALDAATSHGMGGYHGSDAGTRGTSSVGTAGAATGRELEHSTTGRDTATTTTTTSGVDTQHRGDTDTSTRSNQGNISDDTGREGHSSDTQHPSQGKDPSLTETTTRGGLKGEGVDGSHSAVFGLTPDGHKHNDTAHGSTKPVPAHTREQRDSTATGDTGSRAATGGSVAEQMHDPRVAEKGHGGPSVSDTGSAKPGAGAPGGEQGFGQVRPEQHGGEAKAMNKLDPTTDADNDGKRGIGD